MPESPYYLMKRNKIDQARANLVRLSSSTVDSTTIDKRLNDIQEIVEFDMKNKSTLMELFANREYRMSLYIMSGDLYYIVSEILFNEH
jgi:Sugar (and other) transporter